MPNRFRGRKIRKKQIHINARCRLTHAMERISFIPSSSCSLILRFAEKRMEGSINTMRTALLGTNLRSVLQKVSQSDLFHSNRNFPILVSWFPNQPDARSAHKGARRCFRNRWLASSNACHKRPLVSGSVYLTEMSRGVARSTSSSSKLLFTRGRLTTGLHGFING